LYGKALALLFKIPFLFPSRRYLPDGRQASGGDTGGFIVVAKFTLLIPFVDAKRQLCLSIVVAKLALLGHCELSSRLTFEAI